MPTIWIRQQKEKFFFCGNHMFLNHYFNNRKHTIHHHKAISILLHLQNILESLTEKEKKKLCLYNPSGQEYVLNTIYQNTDFTPKKKVIKNEKNEK